MTPTGGIDYADAERRGMTPTGGIDYESYWRQTAVDYQQQKSIRVEK